MAGLVLGYLLRAGLMAGLASHGSPTGSSPRSVRGDVAFIGHPGAGCSLPDGCLGMPLNVLLADVSVPKSSLWLSRFRFGGVADGATSRSS